MNNIKVSFFKTIVNKEDINNPVSVSVKTIFNAIREGKYKKTIEEIRLISDNDVRNSIKKKLPAATFAGVFSARRLDAFISPSGIVCCDFDKLSHQRLKELRGIFKNDEHVYACFVSPSGSGLKVLVKASYNTQEEYKSVFYALDKHFGMLDSFDMNTSDMSRATYMSYDEDIYVNEASKVFEEYVDDINAYQSKRNLSTPQGIFSHLEKWLDNKGKKYIKGERNPYLYVMASAACRYGVREESFVELFINRHSDLSRHEIVQTVKSAYKRNDFGVVDISEFDIDKDQNFYANIDIPDFEFVPESVIADNDELNNEVLKIASGIITSQKFGVEGLDKYMPLKTREFYGFVAASKAGKTLGVEFLALLAAASKDAQWKFMVISTETALAEYKAAMVSLMLDKPIKKCKPEETVKALEFIDAHFVFIENTIDHLQILDVYHYLASINHFIDCIIIDPISNVSMSKKLTTKAKNEYYDELYTEYLKFTKKYCSIWLIAHVATSKEREMTVPYVQDADYGVHLARRTDVGVTFWRDTYGNEKYTLEMHVRLMRSTLTRGGETTNKDKPIKMTLVFGVKHPPMFHYDIEVDGIMYANPLTNGDNLSDRNELI